VTVHLNVGVDVDGRDAVEIDSVFVLSPSIDAVYWDFGALTLAQRPSARRNRYSGA